MLRRSQWEQSPLLWLTLLLLVAAAVRSAILFVWLDGGMWSIDGGAYLLGLDVNLGAQPDTFIRPRPILAPGVHLLPFTLTLGDVAGFRAFSVWASLLPIPASYYLARSFMSRPQSMAVAGLISVDLWLVQGLVVAPNIPVACACLAIALRPALEWASGEPSKRSVIVMALALALLPHVNQTFAGLTIITFGAILPAALWLRWRAGMRWQGSKVLVYGLLGGGALSLLALPWYLPVAPGSESLAWVGPLVSTGYWDIHTFTAGSLAIVVWIAVASKSPPVKALCVLATVCVLLMTVASSDEAIYNLMHRSAYLAAMPAAILIVHIGSKLGFGKLALGVWLGAFLALSVALPYYAVSGDNGFQMYSEDMMDAVTWASENMNEGERMVFVNHAATHFAASMTGLGTLNAEYQGKLFRSSFGTPATFEQAHIAIYCALGWNAFWQPPRDAVCDPADVISSWRMRYALVNKHLYRQLYSEHTGVIDAAWFVTDALPYTRLVWQRGDVYVWELDAAAAAASD